MGGNAIKNARRIDKEELDSTILELKDILPELNFELVKSYKNKIDFGDIDLVTMTDSSVDLKSLISDRLKPVEVYDNGPFYSVNYKDIQVDFIFMHSSEFWSALNFFHWNDLGNFIGRVARSLNFKYGHDGLSYDKHYSDHYKISIPISTDQSKILPFLGYDYDQWVEGFDDKEDIFKYATSSPYFNALYFSLDNQNHNDRVRNKKRKMYQDMLTFINDNDIQPRPKLSSEERLVHYDRAIEIFGSEFDDKVKLAQEKYDENKRFSEIFNGNIIVSSLSGLTGKELGSLMTKIKNETNYKENVLQYGNDYIIQMIEKFKGN